MLLPGSASAFLLALHRAARRLPHAQFRGWLFAELGRCLRFDSAFWMRTVITESGPVMQDCHLDRQWPDRISGYLDLELWKEDAVVASCLSQPSTTLKMAVTEVPEGRLRDFLERREQEHVIMYAEADAVAKVMTGIAIFRARRVDPFESADREFMEAAGPHIIDTWTQNWFGALHLSADADAGGRVAFGMLAGNRMLTAVDDRFVELMRTEWPQWHGPSLPKELLRHASMNIADDWRGRQTVARVNELQEGRILVRLRKRHALDTLSPRKRQVARLFAGGHTQSSIAAELELSLSTINNYLVDIYRDLGVGDKAQLAVVVSRMPD